MTFDFETDIDVTLTLRVHVHGTCSPAVTGGPPDNWSEEEYEDERTILGVVIAQKGSEKVIPAFGRDLYAVLKKLVAEADIDIPPEPDPEPEED